MSIIKNLLLTTALISAASITSAATINSNAWQFSTSTEIGIEPDIFIYDIFAMDQQLLFVTNVHDMSANVPQVLDVNSSISQNIGQVNSGDVLTFNLTRQSSGGVGSYFEDFGNLHRAFREVNGVVTLSNNLGSQSQVFTNLGDIYEPCYMGGCVSPLENIYEFNQISIPLDPSLVGGTDTNLSIGFTGRLDTYFFEYPLYGSLNDVADLWDIEIYNPNPIPVPAAAWLFGSALAGLKLIRRRK
jgi:hypothetical protein